MAESDIRRRLDFYPFCVDISPLYQHVDRLAHLNNVAQAGYFEEGMIALHRHVLEGVQRAPGHGVVLKLTILYVSEGRYPDPLRLGVGVSRFGTSSYEIGQGLFQGGRCVSLCDLTIVHTEDGRAAPVSEPFRRAFSHVLLRSVVR
jgi:acyl-CoA thioester hydrolase